MPLGTALWSPQEDARLVELVALHGPKKWSQIACDLGSKGSKQCRRRWKNYLSLDDRKLGSWTPEEDAQLLDCHRRHGNKWTLIAQEIGGRTDNAVKNRWAALEKKRRGEAEGGGCARGGGGREAAGGAPRDLLGVRRIITKDQPQRGSYAASAAAAASRQLSGVSHADAMWLQAQLSAAAAAAAQQQQDQDQMQLEQVQQAYNMQAAAAAGYSNPSAAGDAASSLSMRKPADLVINIPGSTAPEVPYSQRTHAANEAAARLARSDTLTPSTLWLGQGLASMDVSAPPTTTKHEDDGLLSIGRQGPHAMLAGLATPTEEPSSITDLFRYLYGAGATPAAAAAAAAAGNAGAAPWNSGGGGASGQPVQQQQQAASQPVAMQQQQPQGAPMQLQPQAPTSMMPPQQQQQLFQQPSHAQQVAYCTASSQQQQLAAAPYVQQLQPSNTRLQGSGMQQQAAYAAAMQFGHPQQHHQHFCPLSKLSRDGSNVSSNCSVDLDGMLQSAGSSGGVSSHPSLPDGMMLRQQMPAPPAQTRFVPQEPPAASAAAPVAPLLPSGSSMALAVSNSMAMPVSAPGPQQMLMMPQSLPRLHAAGQPGPFMPAPTMMAQQQAHIMMQQQQQAQYLQQQQQAMLQAAQQHQWGSEELRQLLDILGEAVGGSNEGQQALMYYGHQMRQPQLQRQQQQTQQPQTPLLPQQALAVQMPPPLRLLCHMDRLPTCESDEVEATNNVAGRVLTAPN